MFKALLSLAKTKKQAEQGQGLVEYALILVLVAVVVIVILAQLGPGIGNIFSTVNAALQGSSGGSPDSELVVTWNPPADYDTTTATSYYTISYEGSLVSGVNLSCTNGFSSGETGSIYYVKGPRGGNSTCTATYSGASANFPVSFGA